MNVRGLNNWGKGCNILWLLLCILLNLLLENESSCIKVKEWINTVNQYSVLSIIYCLSYISLALVYNIYTVMKLNKETNKRRSDTLYLTANLTSRSHLFSHSNHRLECTRPRYFLPLYIPACIGPCGSPRRAGTENRQETCSKNHTETTLLADLWLLFSALPLAKPWLDTLFGTKRRVQCRPRNIIRGDRRCESKSVYNFVDKKQNNRH